MEWNWFFSAVSQCAAAIVAIIGAFIIREALDAERSFFRNTELMTRYEKRTELLARKCRIFEPQIRALRDEEIDHSSSLVDAAYRQGGEGHDLEWFIRNVELPEFVKPDQKRSIIARRLDALASGAAPAARETGTRALDSRERSEVFALFHEVREHAVSLEGLDADIRASKASVERVKRSIWWAVMLYYAGVLVPLLLTPAGEGGVLSFGFDVRHIAKYFILAAVSVIVTLLMTTIGKAAEHVGYPEKACRGVCEHSSLSFYSKYFDDLEGSLL
jgi:hypothetical protein